MKEKTKPMRKCVGCEAMKKKSELLRIVMSPEGDISIDPIGKKPGRGAYICPSIDCLEQAYKARRLERSFKKSLSVQIYEDLRSELTHEQN